jgi:hypothetical protein
MDRVVLSAGLFSITHLAIYTVGCVVCDKSPPCSWVSASAGSMSRGSTARRRPGSGLKFRHIGPRHGPMKSKLFNYFKLVSYRLYIVVIFGVYVVKLC